MCWQCMVHEVLEEFRLAAGAIQVCNDAEGQWIEVQTQMARGGQDRLPGTRQAEQERRNARSA